MRYASVRQLRQEIINCLLIPLNGVFLFNEVFVVDGASDDTVLVKIEIVLHLLELRVELLGLIDGLPLVPLPLLAPLLPRIHLRPELLVSLLDQLHVQHSAKRLLLTEPLLKKHINRPQVQLQVSQLQLVL